MSTLWPQLEPILGKVQKPARYIGLEDGAQRPDHDERKVAWLLTYPDTYEIGLPNQGLQILYEILNERDDAVAERSYAPWTDLEALLRKHGLPLFSVDTHRPAAEFDILAFNLSAELTYTNLLNCVDLAGVPVRSADRRAEHPLVAAGGHCTYNPEPIADFVDFVVLGDGEEVVSEITEVVREWKASGRTDGSREHVLRELSKVVGVYVPSMYEFTFTGADLVAVEPRHADVPALVEKRTIADLGDWPYPKQQLVPLTEVVHDRLNVEVFRGCTRGCRFCQAGMITRPVRERPAEQVRMMIDKGLERTGYDEVALTSLSTADMSGIEKIVGDTVNGCGATPGTAGNNNPVSVSLPSLRVDAFTVGIAAQLQQARRTGLTFAPEAGSWRLRQVINKLIREEDLYAAVESAYSQGWRRMKLYFLTGLPTETDEDTLGIAELGRNVVEIGKRHHKSGASVTLSVGGFVPKPFTPFQWFGQNTPAELQRKINLVRDDLRKHKAVKIKWHDPKATLVEGMMSRGDRRLGPVIEDVWRGGGTFQEWSEHFNQDLWLEAMARHGLSVDWYVHRHRTEDEVLPWDHLSAGLHKDFLWQDWRDSLNELGLEDCRWTPCYDCGACTGYSIEHIVASATPPAGGSQGTGQDLLSGGEIPVELIARPAERRAADGSARLVPTAAGRCGCPLMRVRFRFTKVGKVRFTSHRDVARLWERALRRAGLPVASTEGFNPRPKVHFGLALPTGHESLGEYIDVDFRPDEADTVDVASLPEQLTPLLPIGLDVETAAVIERSGLSLQEAVISCSWRIGLVGPLDPPSAGWSSPVPDPDQATARAAVAALLAADHLPVTRERKGKVVEDDIRPAVLELGVADATYPGDLDRADNPVILECRLATQPRGIRPAELVATLSTFAATPLDEGPVTRTHQWIALDGTLAEPLPPGATRATHAQARAS